VKLDLPRGMRDISQEDAFYIHYIKEKFYDIAACYNFQVIEPSPIELLSTLEAKSGESIINEVYSFKDKGSRDVALRYDLTIGITRFAVSKRDMRIPLKLANFGGVFRYDEPQAGRYRYFHQWDIEIYDNFTTDAEAEIIDFVSNFFNKLNLDTIIEISDRRILEEYIRIKYHLENENLLENIFRAIDKVSKKGMEKVCREYKDILDEGILLDLLEISSFKGSISDLVSHEKLKNLQSIKYLEELFSSLDLRGIQNIRVNLGIVRGLDYYSGIVFEVFDASYKVGSLLGGGRYDKLTRIFGRPDIGAAGAAGGIERIILALQYHKKLPKNIRKIIYIANSNELVRNSALSILSSLRKKGFSVEYDLSNRSLRKQLYDASAKGVSVTIIVAPEEISQNSVIIKNMKNGNETVEKIEALENKISQFL
jgi:histidyl-tRNA synthetase